MKEMNNEGEFKDITNIQQYIMDGIKKEKMQLCYIQKTEKVYARPGIPGEIIITIPPDFIDKLDTITNISNEELIDKFIDSMDNGKIISEAINVVTVDENGLVDMVVTNMSNESYPVRAKVFSKRYKQNLDDPNTYIRIGIPDLAVTVYENIKFKTSRGSMAYLKSGGFIIVRSFYDFDALQQESFKKSYGFYKIPEDAYINEETVKAKHK
jgi:hypothetical protein